MTKAQQTLANHGAIGHELPNGMLRVLSVWTRAYPDRGLELGQTWETIERGELLGWLGY